MDYKVLYYLIGRLMGAASIAMCLPLFYSIICGDGCYADFCGAIIISVALTILCSSKGELTHESLTIREGIAVTGICWILFSVLASTPFLIGEHMGVIDALFEGVSGITGTGASVMLNITHASDSILLWRALTHWLGGLGIIVIFVALFPQPGNGIIKMFEAETTGPTEDRVMPRIRSTAKALLIIYMVLTAILFIILRLCGLDGIDSLAQAMSAIGTGGFSSRDGSIQELNNLTAEIFLIIFMLIGGGNFGLYFYAWRKKNLRAIWQNLEFRVYITIFLVMSILISLDLFWVQGIDMQDAVRQSAFMVAAVQTTTGFTNNDFTQWPAFAQFCLLTIMFIGGCAGSTSGGLKMTRVIILFRMTFAILQEKLNPNSVTKLTLDNQYKEKAMTMRVARFFFMYIAMAMVAAAIYTLDGMDMADAVMLGISCIGNAGVAFGEAADFAALPDITKLASCFFMLLGRLEIYVLLMMLYPRFWRRGNW